MSDEHLRALERRWKETGSEQDELAFVQELVRAGVTLGWETYSRLAELSLEACADYLRARVRRGDLQQERLRLAAYCSHQPAQVALNEPEPEQSTQGVMQWVADHPASTPTLREQFCWRAASAAVAATWKRWETDPGDGGAQISEVLNAVRGWLDRSQGPPPFTHLQALPIIDTSAHYSSPAQVLQAIQTEVVPWLLSPTPT